MAERAPPKIESVEWCRDCGGTGADYDERCRPITCTTCGGHGFVPDSPSGADGRGHNEGEGKS